jgi:putative DNA primase/helicase
MPSDKLNTLLGLTRKNIRIFPINGIGGDGYCECHQGVDCPTPGKHPKWSNWIARATDSPERVGNWNASFPGANWGALTGRFSRIVIVDIDPRNGGEETWAAMLQENGVQSETEFGTVIAETGSGGRHIYFKRYGIDVRSHPIADGVDIKGEDSLVVIPPSMHMSGNKYKWVIGPDESPIANMPEWLKEKIGETSPGSGDWEPLSGPIPEGERNNTLWHHSVTMLRAGSTVELVTAAIRTAVDDGATEGQPISDTEIESVVTSARKYVERGRSGDTNAALGIDHTLNDAGNAARFANNHAGRFLYTLKLGQWFAWKGHYWMEDPENLETLRAAVHTAERIMEDAVKASTQKAYAKIVRWAQTSLNHLKLNAMIKMARANPKLQTTTEQLDTHSHLMVVKNGVLNLKTGTFEDPNPEDLLTRLANVDYNPDAEAPFWLKSLDLAFDGDQKLVDYMQRALGYSLTGETSEQCLFICHGEQGNNGKSTILEAVSRLLGDHAMMSDFSVLSADKGGDSFARSNMADMRASRFVNVNEAKNVRIDETLVKQLTGGDTIVARRLYHEAFRYVPQFKIWIRANDIPIIQGTDNAIWRRMKLIPFLKEIPKSERRARHVVDRKLDAEAEGIFAWMVEGARMWYERGLEDPEIVTQAVDDYRSDMDTFSRFLADCTDESNDSKIATRSLYVVYKDWTDEQGIRAISKPRFNREMVRKNVELVKEPGGKEFWTGRRIIETLLYLTDETV